MYIDILDTTLETGDTSESNERGHAWALDNQDASSCNHKVIMSNEWDHGWRWWQATGTRPTKTILMHDAFVLQRYPHLFVAGEIPSRTPPWPNCSTCKGNLYCIDHMQDLRSPLQDIDYDFGCV